VSRPLEITLAKDVPELVPVIVAALEAVVAAAGEVEIRAAAFAAAAQAWREVVVGAWDRRSGKTYDRVLGSYLATVFAGTAGLPRSTVPTAYSSLVAPTEDYAAGVGAAEAHEVERTAAELRDALRVVCDEEARAKRIFSAWVESHPYQHVNRGHRWTLPSAGEVVGAVAYEHVSRFLPMYPAKHRAPDDLVAELRQRFAPVLAQPAVKDESKPRTRRTKTRGAK